MTSQCTRGGLKPAPTPFRNFSSAAAGSSDRQVASVSEQQLEKCRGKDLAGLHARVREAYNCEARKELEEEK